MQHKQKPISKPPKLTIANKQGNIPIWWAPDNHRPTAEETNKVNIFKQSKKINKLEWSVMSSSATSN